MAAFWPTTAPSLVILTQAHIAFSCGLHIKGFFVTSPT
ncbi:hypothetical protein BQ8794_30245 [Mesorhizobium prunaredense]|uniref:Uncharacterized protein n=1 Tax=Mesorhizobium prunaredense TaxID=1631249 RepID=A0A1R3VA45_9HYPH|nr:hypothetical protein BQ8794_30245 [Mesorhizobium prunaredense]